MRTMYRDANASYSLTRKEILLACRLMVRDSVLASFIKLTFYYHCVFIDLS